MTKTTLDSQSVEIIGRNRLIEELLQAGVEVAIPLRDRGVDLIAYIEKKDDLAVFLACQPGRKLRLELERYRMSAEKWKEYIKRHATQR